MGYKDDITDVARQSGINITSGDISKGQAAIEDTLVRQAGIRTTEPFTVFLLLTLNSAHVASFARAMHRLGLQRKRKSVIFFPEADTVAPWMKRQRLATVSAAAAGHNTASTFTVPPTYTMAQLRRAVQGLTLSAGGLDAPEIVVVLEANGAAPGTVDSLTRAELITRLKHVMPDELGVVPSTNGSATNSSTNTTTTAAEDSAIRTKEALQYLPVRPGSLDVLDMVDGSIALDFTGITGERAAEAVAFHAMNRTVFAPGVLVARVYDSILFAAAAFRECVESALCRTTNSTESYKALRGVRVDGITGLLVVEDGTNDMVSYSTVNRVLCYILGTKLTKCRERSMMYAYYSCHTRLSD